MQSKINGIGLKLLLTMGVLCFALGVTFAGKMQSQAEMNRQAYQKFEQADAVLNQTYVRLMKRLNEPQKIKLRKAQRAWLAFRNAEAAFRASEMAGGSAEPLLNASYSKDLTQQRTHDLKDAYTQFIGKGK